MSDTGPRDDAVNAIVETIEDQLHDQPDHDSLFILEAVVRYCRSLRAVILSEQERKGGA